MDPNTYETETSGRAGSSLFLWVSKMVVTLWGLSNSLCTIDVCHECIIQLIKVDNARIRLYHHKSDLISKRFN